MPIKLANLTAEEDVLIQKIIERAMSMDKYGVIDYMGSYMVISAVHHHTPLDLQQFLDGPDYDFARDFWGIRKHFNFKTGELEDFFLPRFAKSQHETE